MAIHFVNGKEPIGITYCGGNIYIEVPATDRVTLEPKRVTCLACKLLLKAAKATPPAPTEPTR